MNKRIFSFIFARGGSKGIPKKNLLKIDGTPLLGHSINMAKSIGSVEKIFVSTDCDEIAIIGEQYGAEIIKRPKNLARDETPEWLAWKHAINSVSEKYGNFDIFLSLPTTSPLRKDIDVSNCLKKIIQPKVDAVITICESNRSPWFNMVTKENEKLNLLIDNNQVFRRQDSPKSFDITTVAYALKTDFIRVSDNIWQGNVFGVEIPLERSIDIDNFLDYKIANFLFHNNKSQ